MEEGSGVKVLIGKFERNITDGRGERVWEGKRQSLDMKGEDDRMFEGICRWVMKFRRGKILKKTEKK